MEMELNLILMKKEILAQYGMEQKSVKKQYDKIWEIDNQFILKQYDYKETAEKIVQLLKVLHAWNIPVAKLIKTKEGKEYVMDQDECCYILTNKLLGDNLSVVRDKTMARKMGKVIGTLHMAFRQCEKQLSFYDNNFLEEMNGWVYEELKRDKWTLIDEMEFQKAVMELSNVYEKLPKQLIHRDVHFGNFLFFEGEFSGYIDFDLSQRNIRIFDLCYFMLGLLTEEENKLSVTEWLEMLHELFKGYETIAKLTELEKKIVPCIMENIEILFIAYFISTKEIGYAKEAVFLYKFIKAQKEAIEKVMISV